MAREERGGGSGGGAPRRRLTLLDYLVDPKRDREGPRVGISPVATGSVVCVSVGVGFRTFGGVRVRCLSVCPLCPVPGVPAVACPSSRVSCPGVEILR